MFFLFTMQQIIQQQLNHQNEPYLNAHVYDKEV